MFTIYSPKEKRYLNAVSFYEDEPHLEWGDEIDEKGLIATKEDAILMAKDTLLIRMLQRNSLLCIQVLDMLQDPVYEIVFPSEGVFIN